MQILRAADHRRMAWKNGGGETVEVAVFPAGAGLGDFDWRVSMARVATDGPFSLFAGIDRTLALLDGAGMVLSVEGRAPVELRPGSAPLRFPADLPTDAKLLGGPITDLNVMTRRGVLAHRLDRLTVAGAIEVAAAATTLLLCHSGQVAVTSAGTRIEAGPLDAVLAGPAALRVEGEGLVFRIAIATDVSV